MTVKDQRPWPCPECGSEHTVPDERDGYQRLCQNCGHRAAFEAFSGRPAAAFEDKEKP